MSKKDGSNLADQFGEELEPTKSKSSHKKIFITGMLVLVLVVIATFAMYFFTQHKQSGNSAIAYQDTLKSILEKPNNNNNNSNNGGVKINPITSKQNDNDKSELKESGIKKFFKDVLESMQKQQENTVSQLAENNQKSLDVIKNSIAENQKSNTLNQHRFNRQIADKVNQDQKTMFNKLSSLFKTKKPKAENFAMLKTKVEFELVGISLWDSTPKATVRYQGHTSIVSVGSVRLDWKVINIDFDKEQITVRKNGQEVILEKIL